MPSNTHNICTSHRESVGTGLLRISLWLQQWFRAVTNYEDLVCCPLLPDVQGPGDLGVPSSIGVSGEWKLRLTQAVCLAESALPLAQVPRLHVG